MSQTCDDAILGDRWRACTERDDVILDHIMNWINCCKHARQKDSMACQHYTSNWNIYQKKTTEYRSFRFQSEETSRGFQSRTACRTAGQMVGTQWYSSVWTRVHRLVGSLRDDLWSPTECQRVSSCLFGLVTSVHIYILHRDDDKCIGGLLWQDGENWFDVRFNYSCSHYFM